MQPEIFYTSPIQLNSFTQIRREPIRPIDAREADFYEKFDDNTLFFDVFRSIDSTVLIGPPLFNLAQFVTDMKIYVDSQFCETTLLHMDRIIRVHFPSSAETIAVCSNLGSFDCAVSPSHEYMFAGRRVLLTLSKNNRLDWIQDWIRYHRDNHAADAVLIYDNASTDYDAADLAQAIGAVGGLKVAAVVVWPFKYGPLGGQGAPWDSDFCQSGVLEHARWRFLRRARSVMNGDIDELVVGPRSVFKAAEMSARGVVSYDGFWLFGVCGGGFDTPPQERARHRDFFVAERPRMRWGLFSNRPNRCKRKWTVVPQRCSVKAQWRIHGVSGLLGANVPSLLFSYRHLQPINTNWWYQRDRIEIYDRQRHCVDRKLKDCLDSVAWDR